MKNYEEDYDRQNQMHDSVFYTNNSVQNKNLNNNTKFNYDENAFEATSPIQKFQTDDRNFSTSTTISQTNDQNFNRITANNGYNNKNNYTNQKIPAAKTPTTPTRLQQQVQFDEYMDSELAAQKEFNSQQYQIQQNEIRQQQQKMLSQQNQILHQQQQQQQEQQQQQQFEQQPKVNPKPAIAKKPQLPSYDQLQQRRIETMQKPIVEKTLKNQQPAVHQASEQTNKFSTILPSKIEPLTENDLVKDANRPFYPKTSYNRNNNIYTRDHGGESSTPNSSTLYSEKTEQQKIQEKLISQRIERNLYVSSQDVCFRLNMHLIQRSDIIIYVFFLLLIILLIVL